jgi:NAD+ dependent glucose-6-phosphate dehydrogenase
MMTPRSVLITGAAGNLGQKLRRALEGRYELRLLDRDPRGDAAIQPADLSRWEEEWVRCFQGADAVVHLAADPVAYRSWAELCGPNVDALINVYEAAARSGVRRFVFASSNHVMGGYQDRPEERITPDLPPLPGTRYVVEGQQRESSAYGAAKLFGERLGECYAASRGLSVIAVRIGWALRGENRPEDLPAERGEWFRLMWLSNRDFCRLMECSLRADPAIRFAVVNGMSANTGMRWDLTATRELLGYEPLDDVTRRSVGS